ncbi:MAG: DEAD/DEAH box helicase family protein [Dehalococcoidia bacterium]
MALAVENPIVNKPFEEPTRHHVYEEGQPLLKDGRRPAGYYFNPRTRARTGAVAEEQFIELTTVNEIRRRVAAWRASRYRGATRVTKELFELWNAGLEVREHPLFFCQREAAETIIWLVEAPASEKVGIVIPRDEPSEPDSLAKGYGPLVRHCCKMATGSGKTVVMAMVIAWSVLNKVHNPQDRRFSDAVLVVCPNLTVRERLRVLYPSHRENYYERFEVVPRSLMPALAKGRYLITNWHAFLPQDDSRKRSVVKRGPESDTAFCNRVLRDLGPKQNILVLNDEAHHAYRPAPPEAEEEREIQRLMAEERKRLQREQEEATVWVSGLDRVNAARGINFCVDLSATPFYIRGSGHPEGSPLQWIISDFGLVDAVESGIVKIPRVPVDDNSGQPIPKYFHVWKSVMEELPPQDRATQRRKPNPEAVLRHAEGALVTLASEWKKTLERFEADGYSVPPAIILVCDNTDLAQVFSEYISAGGLFEELANTAGREHTMRIDTKLLDKAESVVEGLSRQDAAEVLREKVATVGKEGEPGEQVRCVVSVGMLTEGWDAQNVTQIFGLRAFDSQLLCEQVVGRGLRRMDYTNFEEPEYVDVYGVPFEVIPVKKTGVGTATRPKPSTLVQALPERKHLEIRFPRVEGYIFDVRERVRCDVDALPLMYVDPEREPTEVIAKDAVGMRIGRPDRLGPGVEVIQDRNPFHRTRRLQASVFEIAARITDNLKSEARRHLFPQVLRIVWDYIERRVRFRDAPPEDVALRKYLDRIVETLSSAIEPDTEAGEAPLLPRVERFRPVGSTSEVAFRTTRTCFGTTKSHISHVVADSPTWEHSVAYQFERMPFVVSHARNDHLDFLIPYEYGGYSARFRPDFLVRLVSDDGSEMTVIVEVKGYERDIDRAKEVGALRWVNAVNHHGGFGRWAFLVCKDPRKLGDLFKEFRLPPPAT